MALDADLTAWLRLALTPELDRGSVRRLLAACGDAADAFHAPEAALAPIVGARAARALRAPDAERQRVMVDRLQAVERWLDAAPAGVERRVVTLGDALYPPAWLQQADPPVLVYLSGQLTPERLHGPALAIVGSRHATPQGLDNASAFARHLGEAGWTVVSGLALGIDGAAHEASLATRGGTVAIVGTGIDVVYPTRHRKLYDAVQREGVLVSEYSPGTPALPHQFPERNRLIAALARGTLVVEAALQSGSLITARLATEMGREVFAIPGSIHSPQSKGCHALIKQGAKLVESAADILDELVGGQLPSLQSSVKPQAEPAPADPLADENPADEEGAGGSTSDPLLDTLGWAPMALDELCARTGLSAATLSAQLLELELLGSVRRLPGHRYERLRRG